MTRHSVRRLRWVGGRAVWHAGPMTMTETRPSAGSTDPETRQVEEALDALLAANDPKAIDNVAFRGARYDAGLAWVHFPKGFGGLGVRPELNKLVEQRRPRRRCPADQSGHVLHGPRRPDDRHPRQRRGQRALPAPDVHGRGGVVPAVLRAGRRLRLRRARHAGGPRRRRVDRQRPEGLEHAGPHRRLRHARHPHRPRRAEAQGDDVLRARHARRRASRCARCARSPARRSSTRST